MDTKIKGLSRLAAVPPPSLRELCLGLSVGLSNSLY